MDLQNVWTIAGKEFSIFKLKKSIIYSILGLVIFISVGFPLILFVVILRGVLPDTEIVRTLLDSFSFWFVIGASMIPTGIAAYSLVGEKVERSLEPLLASPVTDSEILTGKSLAAFIPAIAATYVGAVLYMILANTVTQSQLGFSYYPNWTMGIILLALAPLACILSIEMDILVSANVNDVRTAHEVGLLLSFPFGIVYFMSEFGFLQLNTINLLIIAGITLAFVIALFFVSRSTFRREEILTKWK